AADDDEVVLAHPLLCGRVICAETACKRRGRLGPPRPGNLFMQQACQFPAGRFWRSVGSEDRCFMNDPGFAARPMPVAPPTPARGLAVVSIAKDYDRRRVLSDVSLSVARGEVVGLLGPNGAGKTTCFYSIMGLVKPDAGRILLNGDDITGL